MKVRTYYKLTQISVLFQENVLFAFPGHLLVSETHSGEGMKLLPPSWNNRSFRAMSRSLLDRKAEQFESRVKNQKNYGSDGTILLIQKYLRFTVE